MKNAVLNLKDKSGAPVVPDYLLVDAENVPINIPPQLGLIKGDEKKSWNCLCFYYS